MIWCFGGVLIRTGLIWHEIQDRQGREEGQGQVEKEGRGTRRGMLRRGRTRGAYRGGGEEDKKGRGRWGGQEWQAGGSWAGGEGRDEDKE